MEEKFFSGEVRAKVRNIWQQRLVVTMVLLSHLTGALVVLFIVTFAQVAVKVAEHFLNHGKPLKLFETLPFEFQISWLFDAADFGIIVVLVGCGIRAMWKAEGPEQQ